MNGNQQTAVEIDFREILHIIKKNWTLILAAALTGVFCAAVLVIVVEKPQYRAQAMLFVDAQSQTDVITNDAMRSIRPKEIFIRTSKVSFLLLKK